MPHDPDYVDQQVVERKSFGGHDMVVLKVREDPSDSNGNRIEDPFREYDEWVANKMMTLLLAAFPGYPWRTRHDTAYNAATQSYDKIAFISIPILMGINNYMAVNERTDDLTPGLIVATAAQILERYGLSRIKFNEAEFLDAREKHSALVVPSRIVPGGK